MGKTVTKIHWMYLLHFFCTLDISKDECFQNTHHRRKGACKEAAQEFLVCPYKCSTGSSLRLPLHLPYLPSVFECILPVSIALRKDHSAKKKIYLNFKKRDYHTRVHKTWQNSFFGIFCDRLHQMIETVNPNNKNSTSIFGTHAMTVKAAILLFST